MGETTLHNSLKVTGNLTVDGTLTGDISLTGLTVDGDLTVTGDDVTISEVTNLTVNGPATTNDTLTANGVVTVNNTLTVNDNLTVNGIFLTSDDAIDSSITGSGKTFVNADNGKIFHVTGENTLTIPLWSTLDAGWTIGVVNLSGDTITVNVSGSDILNDDTSVINTSIFTGFYVYKSTDTDTFIAIGTLY